MPNDLKEFQRAPEPFGFPEMSWHFDMSLTYDTRRGKLLSTDEPSKGLPFKYPFIITT